MNSFLLQWFRRLRLALFLFVPALAHAEVASTSALDTALAVPKLAYRCGKSVYYLRDETGISQAFRAFWAFLTRTPEEIYAAELAEAQQGAWNGHEYGLKQAKSTGYCVTEVVTFCVGGEILKGVRGLVRAEKVVELSQEIKLLGPVGDPGCKLMNVAEKAAAKIPSTVEEVLSLASNSKGIVGKIERTRKGAWQGFMKGGKEAGEAVYQELIKKATKLESGAYELADGTIVHIHPSTTTKAPTLTINRTGLGGKEYKIRFES